ncbi:MAG: hypothetical protein C6W57_16470 [Caldibacillus debilis]|uniref:YjcG family protein n=1 Tax=Caldibacillus debilis TaxID=301148 RepID=UPI000E394FA9|nr:YjcG family protein [Caldibacillus debilis]REJ13404.1 MAG: hypothetical protein C6W57_16470 [Caldibacillus debilis]
MKAGIAIFPSKKLQDFANSYRKRYDPKYALIPPHLTLKGPFDINEEDLPRYSEKLEEIAQKYRPFPLRTTKISSFHPLNNVIYIKIEPTPVLMDLYNEINEDPFFGSPSENQFVPHITIGQELSNGEHADVYSQLRLIDVEFEETVDRFHLLYQLDDGIWTVYETFLLGK